MCFYSSIFIFVKVCVGFISLEMTFIEVEKSIEQFSRIVGIVPKWRGYLRLDATMHPPQTWPVVWIDFIFNPRFPSDAQ